MNKEQIKIFLEETRKPVEEEIVFDLINGYQKRITEIENKNKRLLNIIKIQVENIEKNINLYIEDNNLYSIESIKNSINLIEKIIKNNTCFEK